MPRIAIIEEQKCHPDKCGNYLCIRLCPVNKMGDECIFVNETTKKAGIDAGLCTGCGICPKRCPFGAIHIINLPEELAKQPIHQYGKNGFHLYNLPTPLFGKVVGIIGRNGIGKSTAIKILAGVIKPNLGTESDVGYDELLQFFKGTEAQLFFEKIKRGEIKVSYKPQQVDLIPNLVEGTVRTVLSKVDEKDEMEKMITLLDLRKILDTDIAKLSGGEIQRVAIAATVLKKANLYIFDEPTSFLDIKQRLKISAFIKGLADENTAVLVVEHDMIILDAMTDMVHIMYGEESCYGIVSHVRPTRMGINIYLDGYIRDENMRFRDQPIQFQSRPQIKKVTGNTIVEWEALSKKLDRFTIQSPANEIHKGEVIGMLGENGIGKTTFVKMLAGVIEPESGTVDKKIKISYKPQYLEANDIVVRDLLQECILKYEYQLAKPLNLKDLYDRKLNELSGGELQRVAIAECLSKEADLYVLDEPSAFLDVEQRLLMSKLLRELMDQKGTSALIVDHDLMFIDYISSKIMVVDGEPAIHGTVTGPYPMEEGMNHFLEDVHVTFRRDPDSNRPRSNKLASQMDREQKSSGQLYYG